MKQFKTYLKDKGLKHQDIVDIAEKKGLMLHISHVSRLKNAIHWSTKSVFLMCKILDCTPNDILDYKAYLED